MLVAGVLMLGALGGWWLLGRSGEDGAVGALGAGGMPGELVVEEGPPGPSGGENRSEISGEVVLQGVDARRRALEPDRLAPAIRGTVAPREGLDLGAVRCRVLPGASNAGANPQWGDRHRERALTRLAAPWAETQPDGEGNFALEVADGHWTLEVEAPGFAPWREVALVPGDYRYVELVPAVVLFVRVTGAGGEPAAGAWVELCFDSTGMLEPKARAWADADGVARLTAPAGHYTLWGGHPEHVARQVPLALSAEDSGAVLDLALASGVSLFGRVTTQEGGPPPPETSVRVEVGLDYRAPVSSAVDEEGRWRSGALFTPGQPVEVAALAPGFGEVRVERSLPAHGSGEEVEIELVLGARERRARGIAVDGRGRALAGVPVYVQPLLELPPDTRSIPIPPEGSGRPLPETRLAPRISNLAKRRPMGTTDAEGRFEVRGLDPGTAYGVLLVSDTHGNRQVWVRPGLPGSVEELGEVAFEEGAHFFGRISTAQGQPLDHLAIGAVWLTERRVIPGEVYEARLPDSYRGAFDAVTNAAGEFHFGPLPSGAFFVIVQERWLGPFRLAAGERQGPVNLEVDSDRRRETQGAIQLTGHVFGSDGEPNPNAWVRLVRASEGNPMGRLPVAFGPVDAQGAFRFSVPDQGDYLLEAVDLTGRDGSSSKELVLPSEGSALNLHLPALPLPPTAVEGSVFDAAGRPLAGVQVELLLSPALTGCTCWRWERVTDPDGRFDFGPTLDAVHQLLLRDPLGRIPPLSRPVHPRPEPWELWAPE